LVDFTHNEKLKAFLRALCAFSNVVQVCASQSSRTLSMLDCSYSTRQQRSLILQL